MAKIENIYLKCSDTCSQYYTYTLDNSNPIALSAQWRNDASKSGIWDGLLPDIPEIGKQYELSIRQALKMNIADNFWVAYLDPYSTYEGIESEKGINSLVFCLCKKIEIIEIGNKNLLLHAEVIDIKGLIDVYKSPLLENRSAPFIQEQVASTYYQIENFDNFSLIKINIQSDMGWTYIISKKDAKSVIIAENTWDFHQNIWQFNNEALTLEQEKRYGIEYCPSVNGLGIL